MRVSLHDNKVETQSANQVLGIKIAQNWTAKLIAVYKKAFSNAPYCAHLEFFCAVAYCDYFFLPFVLFHFIYFILFHFCCNGVCVVSTATAPHSAAYVRHWFYSCCCWCCMLTRLFLQHEMCGKREGLQSGNNGKLGD